MATTESKRNRTHTDLVEGPVAPVLRHLTIPMIYGIISLVLFNLADTFFVSLLGTEQLAALGFTFPIVSFVTFIGIGLGIGTSATVARVIGEGSHERAARIASDSILLAIVLVTSVSVIGVCSVDMIFRALGASAELIPLIRRYMMIWFTGVVFLIIPMVGSSAMRATGDTRTPSRLMLGAAFVNGVLDPLLIFGIGPFPELGLAGAAVATVSAWLGSTCYGLYVLRVHKHLLMFSWPGWTSLLASWRRHLRISGPAAAGNMMTPVATGSITALVAAHGAEAVAAYGVIARVESLALIVVLALSTSLPPFISQNLGAGRMDRVREGLRVSLRFSVFWELGVYGLILVLTPTIAQFFTDDPAVDRTIRLILYILPLSYGAQGVSILVNSSFNALHEPRSAVILSIARWFVFYVPLALVGSRIAGLHGLFAGAALGNFVCGALATVWIMRHCAGRA